MNRIVVACLLLVLIGSTARASQQGITVEQNWKTMDKCTRQAQTAYPDFTPESNAKRDANLKACLAGSALPPREPSSPAR